MSKKSGCLTAILALLGIALVLTFISYLWMIIPIPILIYYSFSKRDKSFKNKFAIGAGIAFVISLLLFIWINVVNEKNETKSLQSSSVISSEISSFTASDKSSSETSNLIVSDESSREVSSFTASDKVSSESIWEEESENTSSSSKTNSKNSSSDIAAIVPPTSSDTADSGKISDENSDKVAHTVYYTRTGKKYHYANPCGRGTYFPCTLDEAIQRGLTACEKCAN